MIIATERILFYRRGCPVRLQTLDEDPHANYCIQYAGSGQYFKTLDEAQAYIKKRFNRKIEPA